MSLRTQIVLESQEKWYTNGDLIVGKVILDIPRSTELSSVIIKLRGVASTQLTKDPDMGRNVRNIQDTESEQLEVLKKDCQLFLPAGRHADLHSSSYTLSPGKHEFKFEFTIPGGPTELPQYGNSDNVPTVPSLSDVNTPYAAVKYYLKAVVTAGSAAKLLEKLGATSTTSVYTHFPFLPLDGNFDDLRTFGASFTSSSELIPQRNMSGLFSRLRKTLVHDSAPTCAEARFQVLGDTLLVPGAKLYLSVGALLQAKPGAGAELVVSSMAVSLVGYTEFRAHNFHGTDIRIWPLWSKCDLNWVVAPKDDYTMFKSDQLTFELPNTVPPTFSCPLIRRRYWIEVKIKFTHTPGSIAIHKATVKHSVHVRSGTFIIDHEAVEKIRTSYPQEASYCKRPPCNPISL